MTTETIETYIRSTNLPYDEIIRRCVRGGWKIIHDWTGFSELKKITVREATIVHPKQGFWITCHPINNYRLGSHNSYQSYK